MPHLGVYCSFLAQPGNAVLASLPILFRLSTFNPSGSNCCALPSPAAGAGRAENKKRAVLVCDAADFFPSLLACARKFASLALVAGCYSWPLLIISDTHYLHFMSRFWRRCFAEEARLVMGLGMAVADAQAEAGSWEREILECSIHVSMLFSLRLRSVTVGDRWLSENFQGWQKA